MDPIGFDDDPPPEPRDGWLLVRIHVPELNVYKCLQFPSDRLVWDVKQQVLASLPKELKESFNYGLFCPPSNGKAGKFLDEERRLGDYPFNGPVGYLELKYKRRVYKMLNLDEKQLKALHTRANLRRFLECITGGHVDKIAKMCAKGLDPNFHCPESGDTPLTLATGAKKPNKLLIALVNGGALLDYRTKDGSTALHRAVERDCLEAVTTLLELGASPNYKDSRGLTPLYFSVTNKTDAKICESLLHDHGTLGIQDTQGWQEVHQACRHGLVQHLEHLLFYGADMDGHNASGNTPLHVCAVNNQEACARMLLFRGAQRSAINYANQTPYQVAVIAGNLELAEIIQNYKTEDIVPFRVPPRYNPRRRSGIGWGSTITSSTSTLSRLGSSGGGGVGGLGGNGPPSPCPSEHPFSSASSSLSEGSSSHRSHEDDISIVTDKSIGDTSDIISDSSGVGTNSDSAACSIGHPSTTVVCMQPYTGTQLGHLTIQPGDVIEVVGSTDCGLLEGYVRGVNRSGFFPEHCVQEVNIRQKNIVNVSTASEYRISDQNLALHSNGSSSSSSSGTIAAASSSIVNTSSSSSSVAASVAATAAAAAAVATMQHQQQQQQQQQLLQHQHHVTQQYSSATAPRIKKGSISEPRTVILHRAKRGFGFILRGAKAASPLMQLKPSERCPGLQYLDDVDPGGVADMAGLRRGDFLLAINNEDVRCASHEHVVDLIRTSGSLVSMTVISQNFPNNFQQQVAQQHEQQQQQQYSHYQLQQQQQHQQLQQQPHGIQIPSSRQCATLPRKMPLAGGGKQPAPLPPRRDPKTTLSVGRARAKSMVAGLENGGEKDDDDMPATHKSSSAESINHQQSLSAASTPTQTGPGTPVQPRTASIKARPTSSRITAAELEELFQRQQGETTNGNRYSTMMSSSRFQSGTDSGAATPPTSPHKHYATGMFGSGSGNSNLNTMGSIGSGGASGGGGGIVYASVAEMKRKKTKNGTLRGKPCAIPVVNSDLKRTFHSTPDLATALNSSTSSSVWSFGGHSTGGVGGSGTNGKYHRSQDDMHTLHSSLQRLVLPAPTHPPPPPPIGQMVKVDVSRGSEYDSTVKIQKQLVSDNSTKSFTSASGVAANGNGNGNDSNSNIAGNGSGNSGGSDDSEIRSSFKPDNNAKLYASPQDIRSGVFNKRSEQQTSQQQQQQPAQQQQQPQQLQQQNGARQPVRKTSSLRSASSSDVPSSPLPRAPQVAITGSAMSSVTHLSGSQKQLNNPYAQPGWQQQSQPQQTDQLQMNSLPSKLMQAPPIPDPDYSLSESDGETENSILVAHNTKMNEHIALLPSERETSGNSQASGSSSGSGSIPHSFSVDEIQKMRVKLKASKSFPNNLLQQPPQDKHLSSQQQQQQQQHLLRPNDHLIEEGDNSSSGVSSDQEVTINNTVIPSVTQLKPALKQTIHTSTMPALQQQQQQSITTIGEFKKPYAPAHHQQQQQQYNTLKHQHQTSTITSTKSVTQKSQLPGTLNLKKKIIVIDTRESETTMACSDDDDDDDDDDHHNNDDLNNDHKTLRQHSVSYDDDDNANDSPSPPAKGFQRHNSLTRKQAATIAMNRAMQTRSSAVSLIKLPPPIEAEHETENILNNAPVLLGRIGHHQHSQQMQQLQQQQQLHHHHHQQQQQQQQQQSQNHQHHYNQQQQQQHHQPQLYNHHIQHSNHHQMSATLDRRYQHQQQQHHQHPAPHHQHHHQLPPPLPSQQMTENIVLAPPPQFCDCINAPSTKDNNQSTAGPVGGSGKSNSSGGGIIRSVRIVGAVPKVNIDQSALPPLLVSSSDDLLGNNDLEIIKN